jgi:acyl-CoA synthetase (AMP-forming)/AMP-acid ligase II/1-acyl-sn-glycerol-3-phosphate acyltransferase/acyl carrier protein
MKDWLNHLFWAICRFLLGFRYKVTVGGSEPLREMRGPTLVLPNHPAYIDPALVSSHIRLHKPLRPLVFSGTYRMRGLRPLMKLVDAFEVPDMSSQSRESQAKTRAMIDSVVERLQAGDCMLIYPSGRLQRGNREVVGAARAVHEIISRTPNVNVVLVRTRGVWGSMFSCADTGSPPPLATRARQALGWVLANLLFFLPRRPVTMMVEVQRREQLPLESRERFNEFLENWYNADGGEEPQFVRYHPFLGPDQGDYGRAQAGHEIDVARIKPKTIAQVNEIVQAHIGRHLSSDELTADTKLEAIGLDSLDRMDVALKIEQQFGFHSNSISSTLGGLWALADGQLGPGNDSIAAAPDAWLAGQLALERSKLTTTPCVLEETAAAAFVNRALLYLDRPAVADGTSGVLSYRKVLMAAGLMSKRFARLPEQRVGIMLPASAAADIAFMALHLAGKTPVMMNWTTGPASLTHGLLTTEARHVITSRKLVDRLGIEVPGGEYIFLEDIKQGISKFEGALALASTYIAPGSWRKNLPQQDPDEPAVFLFTSGSESLPKTVPLTHRNLIVNIGDGLEILQVDGTDSLLGFLPPFHSFGMTGNLLLPLLAGVPCVRYADPTDAAGLARTIAAYRPTMVFTTPTFLGYILAACRGEELHSLKKIITGAEKCPEAIFQQCKQLAPNAVILEGYGITECSPVVAANRIGNTKEGTVGFPVRSVEALIIDVETEQSVARGETGMLLVRGPSIFGGYLDRHVDSPFVEVAGNRWYKTGDLVAMDEDGFLHFKGRLKRFLKAGGEMISLPALEEPFARVFPPDEHGPRVAVEGLETEDGRHIVLFTTVELTFRAASELLIEAGFRGVMRLDEVRRVDSIPVLGTGKTDYKELRKQVLNSIPA